MSSMPRDTAKLKIITLLSSDEKSLSKGRYVVSIDIVPAENAEKLMKTRNDEKDKYSCNQMINELSPEETLETKDGICEIKFEVVGALQPQKDFIKGQNIIRYVQNKDENRRKIVLVPSYAGSSGDATITFTTLEDRFIHEATIVDVPMSRRKSQESLSSRYSSSASISSNASGFLEVEGCPPCIENLAPQYGSDVFEDELKVDIEPTAGSVQENAIYSSGGGSTTIQNQAIPFTAIDSQMTTPVIPIKSNASVASVAPNSDFKILSDKSLRVLAGALPTDGDRLAIGLGIDHHSITVHHKDYPRDVTQANYQSFQKWKQNHIGTIGQNVLCEQLIKELADMGRSDVRIKIEKVMKENRDLEENDFKF